MLLHVRHDKLPLSHALEVEHEPLRRNQYSAVSFRKKARPGRCTP